jgi:hypothetical protein
MSQEPEQVARAFVLMPFDPEFDAIFNNLIRPALEEVGYDVKRADNIVDQQNILKDIVRGIAEADLVVADLTSLNANVFYEVGISHTMQKPTVLLTQSGEDIPFDLKSYRVIAYSTRFIEAPELAQKLKEIGEKAKGAEVRFGNPVSDFVPEMREAKFPATMQAKKAMMEAEGKKGAETEEREEKGIWDFAVDGEKSMKDITEFTVRMTEATQGIGGKLRQRTADVQRIAQSGIPGAASQVHKLAGAVAMDMTQYAERLEEEQPRLHNAWESFDENASGLVQITQIHTKEDVRLALEFRSSVDRLRSEIKRALEGVQRFRETVGCMKGISRDVNRASKRIAHILDLLISDLEGADSYCTKILALLDEKIDREAASGENDNL